MATYSGMMGGLRLKKATLNAIYNGKNESGTDIDIMFSSSKAVRIVSDSGASGNAGSRIFLEGKTRTKEGTIGSDISVATGLQILSEAGPVRIDPVSGQALRISSETITSDGHITSTGVDMTVSTATGAYDLYLTAGRNTYINAPLYTSSGQLRSTATGTGFVFTGPDGTAAVKLDGQKFSTATGSIRLEPAVSTITNKPIVTSDGHITSTGTDLSLDAGTNNLSLTGDMIVFNGQINASSGLNLNSTLVSTATGLTMTTSGTALRLQSGVGDVQISSLDSAAKIRVANDLVTSAGFVYATGTDLTLDAPGNTVIVKVPLHTTDGTILATGTALELSSATGVRIFSGTTSVEAKPNTGVDISSNAGKVNVYGQVVSTASGSITLSPSTNLTVTKPISSTDGNIVTTTGIDLRLNAAAGAGKIRFANALYTSQGTVLATGTDLVLDAPNHSIIAHVPIITTNGHVTASGVALDLHSATGINMTTSGTVTTNAAIHTSDGHITATGVALSLQSATNIDLSTALLTTDAPLKTSDGHITATGTELVLTASAGTQIATPSITTTAADIIGTSELTISTNASDLHLNPFGSIIADQAIKSSDGMFTTTTGVQMTLKSADATNTIVIQSNLNVMGQLNTISSEQLVIEDKNIILGKTDSPSDTHVDQAGMIIAGSEFGSTATGANKESISLLWNKNGSNAFWGMQGGDFFLSKQIDADLIGYLFQIDNATQNLVISKVVNDISSPSVVFIAGPSV